MEICETVRQISSKQTLAQFAELERWQLFQKPPPSVVRQGLAAYAVSSELGSSLGRLAWGSMVALRVAGA